jgi:hypothetical protein
MKKYKKRKSGKAPVIIIYIVFFILVVGGVIVSNSMGSHKGWVGRILKGKYRKQQVVKPKAKPKPPPAKPVAAKPVPVKTVPVEAPKVVAKVAPKEEKKPQLSMQALYDSLFKKYRKKFKDPEIGKEYTVYLKSGKAKGTLKSFSDGKIVIQRSGATITYRMDQISKRSYPKLFPKKAAKILALKKMKKTLKENAAAEKAREEEDEYIASKTGVAKDTKFEFEVEAQPTPKRLKKPLVAFGEWVKVQQRRIGGKLGEKIYAKQQGRNVVLYMQTSKLFRKQSYDVRFSVAEGMWQIWGFKCIDYGAARAPNQAYIVLLGKRNRIIGNSTINNTSDVWVTK